MTIDWSSHMRDAQRFTYRKPGLEDAASTRQQPVRARADDPLGRLRALKRVPLYDRPIIAQRLGTIACRVDDAKPGTVVRGWFDVWPGDPWGKRKRYVILPGERVPDPTVEGAYKANGGDWATLIAAAVSSLHPPVPGAMPWQRDQAVREVLRGTSILPANDVVLAPGDEARSLLGDFIARLCETVEADGQLRRLWAAQDVNPLKIDHVRRDEIDRDDPLTEVAIAADTRLTGEGSPDDSCSVAMFRPDPDGTGWRAGEWVYPSLRIARRGLRRETRIFRLPLDFADQLLDGLSRDESDSDVDVAAKWLLAKGLVRSGADPLPEIPYDRAKGYGWEGYAFEAVQYVDVSIRPRTTSSSSLWVETNSPFMLPHIPNIHRFDGLAAEPHDENNFSAIPTDGRDHELFFMSWPDSAPFTVDGEAVPGAINGFIEDDSFGYTDECAGWFDDLDIPEVQEALYGAGPSARRVPMIATDPGAPALISDRTVASVILRNMWIEGPERMDRVLLDRARRTATAGLRYHDRVLELYRARLETR